MILNSKKLLLIILFSYFLISCATTNSVSTNNPLPPDKEIVNRYTNVSFYPADIKKDIAPGLSVEVKPLDAATLNQNTYLSALRDGNYEKSMTELLQGQRQTLQNLTPAEKRRLESYLSVAESMLNLVANGKIAPLVAEKLTERMFNGRDYSSDGTDIQYQSGAVYPATYNPYRINNRFLSVFEFGISSSNERIIRLNIDDLQIINDQELLKPLSINYFESIFTSNSQTLQNVYRMNMPDVLTITPNQKIIKFISIPAIGDQSNLLNVQFINNDDAYDFIFNVESEHSESRRTLNSHRLRHNIKGSELSKYHSFYYIAIVQEKVIAITDDVIYLDIDGMRKDNIKFNICAIGVAKDLAHMWGCTDDFLPNYTYRNISVSMRPLYELMN